MSSAPNTNEGSAGERKMDVPPTPQPESWGGAPIGSGRRGKSTPKAAAKAEPNTGDAGGDAAGAGEAGQVRVTVDGAAGPVNVSVGGAGTEPNPAVTTPPVQAAPNPEPAKDDKPKKEKPIPGLATFNAAKSAAANAGKAAEGVDQILDLCQELKDRIADGGNVSEVLEKIDATFGMLEEPLTKMYAEVAIIGTNVNDVKSAVEVIKTATGLMQSFDPAVMGQHAAKAVADHLNATIVDLRGMRDALVNEATNRDALLKQFKEELEAQGVAMEQLAENTKGLQRGIGGVAGKVDLVSGQVGEVSGKLDGAHTKLDQVLERVNNLGTAAALNVSSQPQPQPAPAPAPVHAPSAPAHVPVAPPAPQHAPAAPTHAAPHVAHAPPAPAVSANGMHVHVHLDGAVSAQPAAGRQMTHAGGNADTGMSNWVKAITVMVGILLAIVFIRVVAPDNRVARDDGYVPRAVESKK